MDGAVFRDILLSAGDCYLIPCNIPYSIQTIASTRLFYMERQRDEAEQDHLLWFCQKCDTLLHQSTWNCINARKSLTDIPSFLYCLFVFCTVYLFFITYVSLCLWLFYFVIQQLRFLLI